MMCYRLDRMMSKGLVTVCLAVGAVVALAPDPVSAAAFIERPVDRDQSSSFVANIDGYRTTLPSREVLAAEDLERDHDGLPFRFALPQPVSLGPDNSGTWDSIAGAESRWRLKVSCPGARSLNLGFDRFFIPPGARLLVYPADGSGPWLSFDAMDVKDHGELWTPVLASDDLVVELTVPRDHRHLVDLHLGSIGRGYRDFVDTALAKSGACNVDVVCPEGDPWRDEIDSVGVYSTGGSTICTGVMVNNTAQDGTPLFLTADHCAVFTQNAASVVVYWNFQSPTCGQQGGGPVTQFQTGSVLRARNAASDFKLLELDAQPNPAFGVKYAGWDRGAGDPLRAVAIHHPNTDEKSISFENDPCTTTTYNNPTSPGDGTHIRVGDWDLGTTEPGSSGSPLFNQNHHIVGQLHGGQAACGNDLPDWYGRLSVSWTGGGTAETSLSDWLDPSGTGAQTVDLYDPQGGEPEPGEHANLRITAVAPNPFVNTVRVGYTVERDTQVRIRLYDLRGRLVNDLGSQNASQGANNFFWTGVDGGGRSVAAGMYVVELLAEDVTHRLSLIYLH